MFEYNKINPILGVSMAKYIKIPLNQNSNRPGLSEYVDRVIRQTRQVGTLLKSFFKREK